MLAWHDKFSAPQSSLSIQNVLSGDEGIIVQKTLVSNHCRGSLDPGKDFLRGLLKLRGCYEITVFGFLMVKCPGLLDLHLLLLHHILNEGLHILVPEDLVHLLTLSPHPLLALLEVIPTEVLVQIPEVARAVRRFFSLDKLRVQRQVVADAVLPFLVRGGVVRVKFAANFMN